MKDSKNKALAKKSKPYVTKSLPKDGKFDPSKWELRTTSYGNGAGGHDTDSFLVKRYKR